MFIQLSMQVLCQSQSVNKNQELLRVGVRVEDGMRQAILNPVDPIDLTLADRDHIAPNL